MNCESRSEPANPYETPQAAREPRRSAAEVRIVACLYVLIGSIIALIGSIFCGAMIYQLWYFRA